MSITHPEVTDLTPTFTEQVRKYDLRTSEGKHWKRLASLSEYSVITGNYSIPSEQTRWVKGEDGTESEENFIRTDVHEALHIVRTVFASEEVIKEYLAHALTHDWSSRHKGVASVALVTDALFYWRWSSGEWQSVTYTLYTLTADGEFTTEEVTPDNWSSRARAVTLLGDTVADITKALADHAEEKKRKEEHERLIAEVKEAFVPSGAYEVAKKSAERFIASGVEPSKGDNDSWHNHVHVAIYTEVLNLCKRFVDILGKTNHEVNTAFTSVRYGDHSISVVDETIAYATVIAERTEGSWSSNDFSSALLGQVIHQFTRVVHGR